MIHVNRERFVYSVIGATAIVWIWPYGLYRFCAALGMDLCEASGIRVTVEQVKENSGTDGDTNK